MSRLAPGGWLSAIALCRPAEAAVGMRVLCSLVAVVLQRGVAGKAGRVRRVGGDGWPLDL